jgi:hypothetical protein
MTFQPKFDMHPMFRQLSSHIILGNKDICFDMNISEFYPISLNSLKWNTNISKQQAQCSDLGVASLVRRFTGPAIRSFT